MLKEIEEHSYALECALSDYNVSSVCLEQLLVSDSNIVLETSDIVMAPIIHRYNISMEDGVLSTIYETIKKIVSTIFNTLMTMFKKIAHWLGITHEDNIYPLSGSDDDQGGEKVTGNSSKSQTDPFKSITFEAKRLMLNMDKGDSDKFGEYMLKRNQTSHLYRQHLLEIKQSLFIINNAINDYVNTWSTIDIDSDIKDFKMPDELEILVIKQSEDLIANLPIASQYSDFVLTNDFSNFGGTKDLFGGEISILQLVDIDGNYMPLISNGKADSELSSKSQLVDTKDLKSIVKQLEQAKKDVNSFDNHIEAISRHIDTTRKNMTKSLIRQKSFLGSKYKGNADLKKVQESLDAIGANVRYTLKSLSSISKIVATGFVVAKNDTDALSDYVASCNAQLNPTSK